MTEVERKMRRSKYGKTYYQKHREACIERAKAWIDAVCMANSRISVASNVFIVLVLLVDYYFFEIVTTFPSLLISMILSNCICANTLSKLAWLKVPV